MCPCSFFVIFHSHSLFELPCSSLQYAENSKQMMMFIKEPKAKILSLLTQKISPLCTYYYLLTHLLALASADFGKKPLGGCGQLMVRTYIYIVIGLCTRVMCHEILSNKKSGFSISNHSRLKYEKSLIAKYVNYYFFLKKSSRSKTERLEK